MNLKKKCYLFMFLLSFITSGHSESIEISGRVIKKACQIKVPSTVPLGMTTKSNIIQGQLLLVKTFDVDLSHCAKDDNNIFVTMQGNYNDGGLLINNGTAKGILILLTTNLISHDGSMAPISLNPNMPFTWNYKGSGGIMVTSVYLYNQDNNVTGGTIDTYAQFVISYE